MFLNRRGKVSRQGKQGQAYQAKTIIILYLKEGHSPTSSKTPKFLQKDCHFKPK